MKGFLRRKEKIKRYVEDVISQVRWEEIRDEAVELLRGLIKIDTTNPPGEERPAAEFVAKYFDEFGIASEIVESDPGRASIIAEVKGENESLKPLILLSHLDVVPANPKEWSVHPFSGEVKDGYVWGRGAIDCKGLAVCEAVALSLVRRMNLNPKRGVKFISVADEEMGGEKGAGFLLNEKNIDGFAVINEGGTGAILGGKRVYLPCFGEKGPLWLKIKAKGKPGHASMPHEDNPNLILVQALYRILKSDLGKELVPNFVRSIKTHVVQSSPFGKLPAFLLSLMERTHHAREVFGKIFALATSPNPKIKAMFSNTLSITIMKAGYKENVIPEEAEAVLDIRLLPGYDPYEFIDKLKNIVDDHRVEFEIMALYDPSESDPAGEFMMILKDAVKSVYDAPFFPILATGFTDSRYFRKKGIPSYGLLPFFLTNDELSTMHGIDERVSIDNLELGVKIMLSLILHSCFDDRIQMGG